MKAESVVSGAFTLPVTRMGRGTPFVLLHGLGSDARAMVDDFGVVPGFEMFVPDQRGHGDAEPEVSQATFGLDDLVGDVDAILAAFALDSPVLGGGSMGAAVSMRFALTTEKRLRALVLVAPAITTERPQAAEPLLLIAGLIESMGLEPAVDLVRNQLIANGVTAADVNEGLGPWLRQNPEWFVTAIRAVVQWRPLADLSELGALAIPVAVLAVEDDPLHPVPVAAEIHDATPGSDLVVLSRAESREPGAVVAAVGAQLARLGVA